MNEAIQARLERRQARITERRIESFQERFASYGDAHLFLAFHATFPLVLTPDLVYQIWVVFDRDEYSRPLDIPWIATADLLLSDFCREVGYELYEMETNVRKELRKRFNQHERFAGPENDGVTPRLMELARFLEDYSKHLGRDHGNHNAQALAEVHRLTGLCYREPDQAIKEMMATLQKELAAEDMAEVLRMADLTSELASGPYKEKGKPLLVYLRGIEQYAQGKQKLAAQQFDQLKEMDLSAFQALRIDLSPPPMREEEVDVEEAPPAVERVLGIDLTPTFDREVDLHKAAEAGVKFCFIRAGSGQMKDDEGYRDVFKQAGEAGLLRGLYFFIYPEGVDNAGTMAAQAGYFASLLLDDAELGAVVDVEQDGLTPEQVKRFVDEFQQIDPYHRPIMIYTRASFWSEKQGFSGPSVKWAAEHPLWIAHYPGKDKPVKPEPPFEVKIPQPWTTYRFLQWTPVGGKLAGQERASLDLNYFNGSLEELRQWAREVGPFRPVEPTIGVKYVLPEGGLAMRSGPAATFAILKRLAQRQAVEVIEEGDWDQVRVDNEVGYVLAEHLAYWPEPFEAGDQPGYLVEIAGMLANRFTIADLGEICFDLGIDFEALPGKLKAQKVRQLVHDLNHDGRLEELRLVVLRERPQTRWPRLITRAERLRYQRAVSDLLQRNYAVKDLHELGAMFQLSGFASVTDTRALAGLLVTRLAEQDRLESLRGLVLKKRPELQSQWPDSPRDVHELQGTGIRYVKAESGLNLRLGPGTEYETVRSLPDGAVVTIVDDGEWAYVHVGDESGYALSQYLAEKRPEATAAEEVTGARTVLDVPYRASWDESGAPIGDGGPEALAMLLNAAARDISVEEVVKQLSPESREGYLSSGQLIEVAKHQGVAASYEREADEETAMARLRDTIDGGNVFIALINYGPWRALTANAYMLGRYVLVVGFDASAVYVHDPALASAGAPDGGRYLRVPDDLFLAAWGGFDPSINPNWAGIYAETITALPFDPSGEALRNALAKASAYHYERAMRTVVDQAEVSEAALREWVEGQLIVSDGTRALVLRGTQETAGLANAAVELLAESRLIQSQQRQGATWYELVADQYVEPILESNRAWREAQAGSGPPSRSIIGFHYGPEAEQFTRGMGDFMRRLSQQGIPIALTGVDNAGLCFEAQELGRERRVSNWPVYRVSTEGQKDGNDYDVPDYSKSPEAAAAEHWRITRAKWPRELDPERVWMEPVSEPRTRVNEGAEIFGAMHPVDWLGRFMLAYTQIANKVTPQPFKVCGPSFGPGEPEVFSANDYELPGMLAYLEYCAQNPDLAALAVHERLGDRWPEGQSLSDWYPASWGRVEAAFAAADKHDIPRTFQVLVTEWGFGDNSAPGWPECLPYWEAYNQWAARWPQVKGAAAWTLQSGRFEGAAEKLHSWIEALTDYALTREFETGRQPAEIIAQFGPTPAEEVGLGSEELSEEEPVEQATATPPEPAESSFIVQASLSLAMANELSLPELRELALSLNISTDLSAQDVIVMARELLDYTVRHRSGVTKLLGELETIRPDVDWYEAAGLRPDEGVLEPGVKYQVIQQKGPSPGLVIDIDPQQKTIIGRQDTNDIVIDEPSVSRRHVQIYFDEGRPLILDLGSANGTFVKGQRISGEPQPLRPGDVISLGDKVTLAFDRSPEAEPGNIFLSYSRKDRAVKDRLAQDLRQAGFSVWTDDGLKPGTSSWQQAIEDQLEAAACLVVLLSPDAKNSIWVQRELQYGETLDKPIIPVLIRGTPRDAMPITLVNLQFVDLSREYERNFARLRDALQRQLGQEPAGQEAAVEPPPEGPEPSGESTSEERPLQFGRSITDMMDRASEVERFRRLLNREVPERIWLIEGEAMTGKSRLLFEFRAMAREERKIPCALVDLQMHGGSYLDLLFGIIQEFGQPFKEVREVAGRLGERPAADSPGSALADLAIQQSSDLMAAEQQRRLFTEAFFVDLTTLSVETQVLLMLDNYEQASTPAKEWITGELLNWLTSLPNVAIVIAGRQVPALERSRPDRVFSQVLGPVTLADYQAYYEVVDASGISEKEIAVLYEAFAGNAGKFAEYVQSRSEPMELD